jgi:ubiquinone/menaquinone biosynthesis C-methylase UbiE
MSWAKKFRDLPRIPEQEVMDDSAEVEAYSSAAAMAYLTALDDTFIAHAERLIGHKGTAEPRSALDIGCGPGQILLKLAQRLPAWRFIGVDRSTTMIQQALAARDKAGPSAGRVEFRVADGKQLPFADNTFDLVICNSVLHHVEKPRHLFAEIARVSAPGGAILLRDLRRPSRVTYPLHVRWHGRHYRGVMYKLYCASVRAAYRPDELAAMLRKSSLADAQIFTRGRTHMGFERELRSGLRPGSRESS